ncbi:TetR/AcrR family transcriptional regulator [Rhodococcus sp. NPDC058481]|uniref:TetR/AcrR family transcriptional regulator n=1 Tax=unclassified Rhodococcus (in: high G+C Gram-positive bacteria) TaxID=192944 RepID=UPI0036592D48
MDPDTADSQLLDAAEALFNERGVQAVGMDAIRERSGVSLKRLYKLYPAKDRLVEAVLRRRDLMVREQLARFLEPIDDPRDRVLAVFDYLDAWFRQDDFRGCTFINTFGELGGGNQAVADIAKANKAALLGTLRELVSDADLPAPLADQFVILANGAMATAAIAGSPLPARQARDAARVLLDAVT